MRQKICVTVCLLLLPFLLLSCGQTENFLEILDGDFVCHAVGTIGGKPFSATLYASGRVVYDSPESLCGIIASEDGKTVTLGDVTLSASSLSGFFLPARLLSDDFEVSGVGTEKGSDLCYVDGTGEHGQRRVYIAKDGTPCRAEGSLYGITVEFEITLFRTETSEK